MTQEQALEVKQVLLQIGGSIPPNLVDPIFNYYRTYIDAGAGKPCTCQPKYWNQMLEGLRDKVEATLASYEREKEIQQAQETVSTSKPGRKKGSAGTV
jgi:hypothetical protein